MHAWWDVIGSGMSLVIVNTELLLSHMYPRWTRTISWTIVCDVCLACANLCSLALCFFWLLCSVCL